MANLRIHTLTVPDDLISYRVASLPASFYYIPNFITPEEEAIILQKIPANRWMQLSKRRLQAHPSTLTAKNTLISASLPQWLTTYPPIQERFTKAGVFKDTKHGAPNHVLINEYNPGEGIMPHEDGGAYSPVVATISLGTPIVLDIYSKRELGTDTYTNSDKGSSADQKYTIVEDDDDSSSKADAASQPTNATVIEDARPRPTHRILQEPGSLLITTGEAYSNLLHGISPLIRDEDLGPSTVANWKLLGSKARFEDGDGVSKRGVRISLTYRDVLKVSKVGVRILGKR